MLQEIQEDFHQSTEELGGLTDIVPGYLARKGEDLI
jgi:hypothetical protein